MSTVFMQAVVSIDGFIADANDDVGPLFDRYFTGDEAVVDRGVDGGWPLYLTRYATLFAEKGS